MAQLKGSIFITSKDIMHLTGKHYISAWRELQTVQDAMEKPKGKVTVKDYCNYYNQDYDLVVESINKIR